MTDDLKQIWQAEGAAETFTKPENLMDRSSTFERKIRRRNILEYAAGVLVLLAQFPLVHHGQACIGLALSVDGVRYFM